MGLTDFNSTDEDPLGPIEDPSIGKIRFFAKSWGDKAQYDDFLHELDSKPCDFAKDFNDVEGTNTQSSFMPTSENSIDDLLRYGRRLKCFSNSKDLRVWGNYNSLTSLNIVAAFDMCDPASSQVTCKSD